MKIFAGLLALFAVATAASAGAGVAAVGNTDPASAVWVSDPAVTARRSTRACQWATAIPGPPKKPSDGHWVRWGSTATPGTVYGSSTLPTAAHPAHRRPTWSGHGPIRTCTASPDLPAWFRGRGSNAIGGGHGHIGVSLGDGTMVSTTSGAVSILSIKGIRGQRLLRMDAPYFYM